MDAAADDLIAALSSPTSHSGVHSRFASYLLPFSPHLPTPNPNPKPPTKKPTKQQRPRPPDDAAIRPLAKRFLPFLCRALHLLPSILRQNPSSGDAVSGSCFDELFEVYDLLLNCLATISPCLAGKPYSVLLQRGRFVCCLEARGHYARAEAEAVATLDSLRSVLLPPLLAKPRRGAAAVPSLLPDPDLVGEANGGADPDVTTLATELTVCLANCACKGQVKEATAYDRVLALVEQVQPWIRLLADEVGRKYQLLLLNSLSRCAFFLTAECALFDVDIVSGFCIMTLRECTKSPTIERLPAIARKICSTVDLGWGGSTLLLLDVLKIVVKSVVCGCEVDLSKAVNEFLEFVAYFSGSFFSTNRDVCIGASKLLYEQGGFFSEVSSPIDSVLFLYATGLYFSSQHRECEEKPQIAADFLSNVEYVQTFGESLVNLARFFCVANGRICVSLDNLCKDSGSLSTQHACSRKKHVCPQSHGCISFLSYLDSLEFVCKILLQHANAAWKHFSEEKTFCCSASMSYILTALHLFIDSCLAAYSCTIQSEGDKERLHEKRGTLLRAIVSAIKISFVTNDKFEKSMSSINCVISSRWIMLEELKFLIPSLSNIGATLYNIGHVEQAPVALDLCCRAVWANVRLSYCRLSPTLEECRIIKDLPKDTTTDVIVDAFARITKIVDILHKCGAKNIYEIVVKSLSELLAAGDMSEYLKGSSVLIRQWIKIVCKDFVDDQSVDNAPLLYHSLKSNSSPLPQKMIGLILELELSAYGLMESRGTLLCRKMQKGIIDILLDDIYCSREYHLERSRVLVWKARALRACGGQNINSCLECLSEAISLLRSILLDCSQGSEPESHELAIAYCLHAHCAQEANLDCEVILKDVRCALNLWSKVGTLGNSSPGGIFQQQSDTLILLLCSMVDLLAMKGCSQFLFDLCKLIIVIWKQENLPLEKLFSLLFTNGRLNHALCNLPIDQGFICYVSQDLGINCHSIEFWRNCFKGHCHYLSMFHQRVWPTDLMFSQSCEHSFGRSFGFDVGVDEVKKTASSLVSEASLNDQSIFIAGYMYYDLSERFSSRGQVSQALYYAKEALQLRKKLLRKKFKFDLRKFVSSENHGCAGQGFVSLEASGSTITEIWPDFTRSGSVGDFLSPWNVLRCYLESILQVGIVHESTGKGAEAEVLFQTGKEISYLQGLPVFGITFTSLLGQLYRKRELWDVAENELKISRNLLAENETFISCKHCKLTLEISVDMQAGDLFWSLFEKDFQKQSINNLSNALVMYQSAVEKLNCSELELPLRSYDKPNTGCVLASKNHIAETKGAVCNHGKAPCAANNVMSPSCTVCVLLSEASGDHRNGFVPSKSLRQISRNEEVGPLLDVRVKKTSRTASCLEKEQRLEAQAKTRTRFSKRTIHAKGEKALTEVNCTNGTSVSDQSCTNSLIHRKASCVIDGIGCSADDICNIFGCWNCLLAISLNSECIENILQLRWDGIRRRHLVALLLKTARALGAHGGKHGAHEVHNIYWQCISLLYCRSFPQDCYKTYGPHLLGLIMDANSDGFLSLERAAILYNMSFFLLKGFLSERLRGACCSFYSIEMSDAVPWLLKAFVLSQETPSLLQEVCRLLACIFLLSTVDSSIQLPLNSKGSLSLNHWAAYFHQTSVGTCLNWHYLSILGELCRTKHPKDRPENFLNKADEDILKFLRFSSENTDHLEEHITEFFHKLPSVPIVCISMLAGDFVNLLGETLLLPSCFPAWTLLSRFDSTNKPVTILLPVDVILEEMQCEGSSIKELGIATLVRDKNWHCPWGYSIIDYVAPSFRKLLEENFVSLSSATLHLTDGQANCVSWWSQRMKLNNHLDKILKNMEESWLGPWRCLLLGHQLANQHTEATLKKFITGLEVEFKLEVNPTLAKAILCGVKSVDEMQECISQLIPYKGYFGRGGCCGKDRFRAFSACHIEAEVPESLICLIENTVKELTEPVARDPVIFVLDTDVQMLPWENFPTIRSHEIYRMPSVGSVFLALTRSNHHYKDESIMAPSFPVVDLLNTFYLLNPSGDLSSTQEEFDQLFRNYEWKGKAGDAPTTEELVLALRNHDLFLYFGHGSGTQYISGKEIEKLDRCAAALLMGCSSGTLLCKGGYAPQGAPLSYLFAGSPAVIANLWDVSDKDIDRFSRALLDSWLQENVIAGNNCSKCCQVTKEFESMTITVGKNSRAKRKGTRGKKLQQSDDSKCCKCGSRRIALYMSEARRACKLPLMIGASPVCYGVPTIISKK